MGTIKLLKLSLMKVILILAILSFSAFAKETVKAASKKTSASDAKKSSEPVVHKTNLDPNPYLQVALDKKCGTRYFHVYGSMKTHQLSMGILYHSQLCRQWCDKKPSCLGWEWSPTTKQCYLNAHIMPEGSASSEDYRTCYRRITYNKYFKRLQKVCPNCLPRPHRRMRVRLDNDRN